MSQDVIQPSSEQLFFDDISSPIAAQILNFCCDDDDADLYPHPLLPTTTNHLTTTTNTLPGTTTTTNTTDYDDASFDVDAAALSALLDPDLEANSSAIYDPFLADQSGQLLIGDSMAIPLLPSVGYVDPMQPDTCSSAIGEFYDPRGLGECGPVGFFAGMEMGMPGMVGQELVEFQGADTGGVGTYGTESMHRVYSSGDSQVIGEGQHLVGGGCSGNPTPLAALDISTLDESSFKVGRLSVEERREKIHRYIKKRNERNFSKKIKYACRKTLADSRPRVRGRFAKNDEFGEAPARPISGHHELDDEEEVVTKEEEDMLDSSDILAHISGMNSFKYNYSLESWI